MDDFPSMLATLERRMSRDDIASALGVDGRELDEIASGYVPETDVAARLRALAATGGKRRVPSIGLKAMAVFVAVDLIAFAAVAFFLLMR